MAQEAQSLAKYLCEIACYDTVDGNVEQNEALFGYFKSKERSGTVGMFYELLKVIICQDVCTGQLGNMEWTSKMYALCNLMHRGF